VLVGVLVAVAVPVGEVVALLDGDGVAVVVGVEALVGELVTVGLGVPVGGGVSRTSTAPMSQNPLSPASSGRGRPRWSVVTAQLAEATASTAGLPGNGAMVKVGPPLSCSGPKFGEMPVMLCVVTPPIEQPAVVWIRL